MARQLATSYESTCDVLRQMWFGASVSEKLTGFLVEWTFHDREATEGVRTMLSLSQEGVGQMLDVTRETVAR